MSLHKLSPVFSGAQFRVTELADIFFIEDHFKLLPTTG